MSRGLFLTMKKLPIIKMRMRFDNHQKYHKTHVPTVQESAGRGKRALLSQ